MAVDGVPRLSKENNSNKTQNEMINKKELHKNMSHQRQYIQSFKSLFRVMIILDIEAIEEKSCYYIKKKKNKKCTK